MVGIASPDLMRLLLNASASAILLPEHVTRSFVGTLRSSVLSLHRCATTMCEGSIDLYQRTMDLSLHAP